MVLPGVGTAQNPISSEGGQVVIELLIKEKAQNIGQVQANTSMMSSIQLINPEQHYYQAAHVNNSLMQSSTRRQPLGGPGMIPTSSFQPIYPGLNGNQNQNQLIQYRPPQQQQPHAFYEKPLLALQDDPAHDKLQKQISDLKAQLTALQERVGLLERQIDNQAGLHQGASMLNLSGINPQEEHKGYDQHDNLGKREGPKFQELVKCSSSDQQKNFYLVCHHCHSSIIKDDPYFSSPQAELGSNKDTLSGDPKPPTPATPISTTKNTMASGNSYSRGTAGAQQRASLAPKQPIKHTNSMENGGFDEDSSDQEQQNIQEEDGEDSQDPVTGQLQGFDQSVVVPDELGLQSLRKKLNLAFIFSDPIMMLGKAPGELKAFDADFLDTEKEFNSLCGFLSNWNPDKQFIVKREAATRLSFTQILQEKPTILHISCHGYFDYNSRKKKNIFSLAFENKDKKGVMEPFDEDKFREILQIQKPDNSDLTEYESPIKVVFVSACYSEPIAELFKKVMNVPIVIAVHQQTQIEDTIAQEFTKFFYSSLIKGDLTTRQAFEQTKGYVKGIGKQSEKFSCCCRHSHFGNCKWHQQNRYNKQHSCKMHTPTHSSCQCTGKFKGLHLSDCKFYLEFFRFYDINNRIPTDLELSVEYSRKAMMLCCCQPEAPHNEDAKFIIVKRPPFQRVSAEKLAILSPADRQARILSDDQQEALEKRLNERDEAELNKILFPNLKEKKGAGIVVLGNAEEMNHMPMVNDEVQITGRNEVVYQIVEYLDSEKKNNPIKIVHLYGPFDVGKTAVVRYASKYCLNRHLFPQGLYYLDLHKKSQVHNFIDMMYDRLKLSRIGHYLNDMSMFNNALQNLISTIRQSKILIIIDNCNDIVEGDEKREFLDALNQLASETQDVRFIVISYNESDFIKNDLIKRVHIQDLSSGNAAKILWKIAQECAPLQRYNSPDELCQHELFQSSSSHKMHTVLGIAEMVREGHTLDEIKGIRQRQIEEAKITQINLARPSLREDEQSAFSWTTNKIVMQVSQKYNSQIKLLYFLCQFPAGLFERDIQALASRHSITDWKPFMKEISQEVSGDEIGVRALSTFRLVTSNTIEDIGKQSHYMCIPKYSNQINQNFLEDHEKHRIFQESFTYMSEVARTLLRSLTYAKRNEIDVINVSGIIDNGIWGPQTLRALENKKNLNALSITNLSEQEINSIHTMYPRPDLTIRLIEDNLTSFLDVKIIIDYIPITNYDRHKKQIHELCITTSSIYFMLDRLQTVQDIIARGKHIADLYNDGYLRSKLLLIEVTRLIKLNQTFQSTRSKIGEAFQFFHGQHIGEGEADCNFLRGVQLLNAAVIKSINGYDEINFGTQLSGSQLSEQSPHSHTLTRAESMQLNLMRTASQSPHPGNMRKNFSSGFLGKFTPQEENKMIFSQYPELKEGLAYMNTAREQFRKISHDFGMAKTSYFLAEFYLETMYGSRVNLAMDNTHVNQYLKDAVLCFDRLKLDSLKARTLRLQALFELRHNTQLGGTNRLFNAKDLIEQALEICEKVKDIQNMAQCTAVLNQIFDEIRLNASNVFIFAKAFPLVEKNPDGTYRMVSTFTRHINDFRNNLKSSFTNLQKVINTRFDTLTEDLLEYVRDHGCRVLHLSSDYFKDGHLCIEGENGQVIYKNIVQLRELFQHKEKKRLEVDVVILALPECSNLPELFVELGVKHVVHFHFPIPIDTTSFTEMAIKFPKRFKKIYLILERFYANLISEYHVDEALREAVKEIEESDASRIMDEYPDYCFDQEVLKEMNGESELLQCDVLIYPLGKNHHKKLFDNESTQIKKKLDWGTYIDSSKQRGPTNILKLRPSTPFTGRHTELFKAATFMKTKNRNLLNIYGPSGIGKTRFVMEVAYFLHARNNFTDGVFYFDLNKKNVRTTDQLTQLLQELNIVTQDISTDLHTKNMLFVFDDIDLLVKHSCTQLNWFLTNLFKNCDQVKVIVTSKKSRTKDLQSISKQFFGERNLKTLNVIEAADLILSCVNRPLTRNELEMDIGYQNFTIHGYLQQDPKVRACCGFPRYLEILATTLQKTDFHSIVIDKGVVPVDQAKKIQDWQNQTTHSDHSQLKKVSFDHKRGGHKGDKTQPSPNPSQLTHHPSVTTSSGGGSNFSVQHQANEVAKKKDKKKAKGEEMKKAQHLERQTTGQSMRGGKKGQNNFERSTSNIKPEFHIEIQPEETPQRQQKTVLMFPTLARNQSAVSQDQYSHDGGGRSRGNSDFLDPPVPQLYKNLTIQPVQEVSENSESQQHKKISQLSSEQDHHGGGDHTQEYDDDDYEDLDHHLLENQLPSPKLNKIYSKQSSYSNFSGSMGLSGTGGAVSAEHGPQSSCQGDLASSLGHESLGSSGNYKRFKSGGQPQGKNPAGGKPQKMTKQLKQPPTKQQKEVQPGKGGGAGERRIDKYKRRTKNKYNRDGNNSRANEDDEVATEVIVEEEDKHSSDEEQNEDSEATGSSFHMLGADENTRRKNRKRKAEEKKRDILERHQESGRFVHSKHMLAVDTKQLPIVDLRVKQENIFNSSQRLIEGDSDSEYQESSSSNDGRQRTESGFEKVEK